MDSLRSGDCLKQYILIRLLAHSRRKALHVDVWLAVTTDVLPQTVVIKIRRCMAAAELTQVEARHNNEAAVLQAHGSHPNVVEYVDSFDMETGEMAVVLSYCNRGSLVDYMIRLLKQSAVSGAADVYPSGMPVDEVHRLFVQMVEGVCHMHDCGIAHMDLKPDNMCLAGPGDTLVIIDWEFAVLVLPSDTPAYTYTASCGTPDYAPLEIYMGGPYDPRMVDVWCLGVCLFMMIFGEMPYQTDRASPMQKFSSDVVFPEGLHPDLNDLLCGMLRVHVGERSTLDHVVKHSSYMSMRRDAVSRTKVEPDKGGFDTPRSGKSSSEGLGEPLGHPSTDVLSQTTSGASTPRGSRGLIALMRRLRRRMSPRTQTPEVDVTGHE